MLISAFRTDVCYIKNRIFFNLFFIFFSYVDIIFVEKFEIEDKVRHITMVENEVRHISFFVIGTIVEKLKILFRGGK